MYANLLVTNDLISVGIERPNTVSQFYMALMYDANVLLLIGIKLLASYSLLSN